MIKEHNSLQGMHTYNKVNIPLLHEKSAEIVFLRKWRQKFQGKYVLFMLYLQTHTVLKEL